MDTKDPGNDRRPTPSGLFRRLRRSAAASDLLPEAVDRRLGPEGTARPRPPLASPLNPAGRK